MTPTFVASELLGISVQFTTTDDWVNEDDAACFVFQGRPQNNTVNFFKGPWRLIAAIKGNNTTPPTSPVTISQATLTTNGYNFVAAQHISCAFVVSRADGRYSSRRLVGPQLAAA